MNREELRTILFQDFGILSNRIQSLQSIVQNEVPHIENEYMEEWLYNFNQDLQQLEELKKAVVEFYGKGEQP